MKNYPYGILTAAVLVGALTLTNAQAQQVPLPKTAAEVPGPPSGTAGDSPRWTKSRWCFKYQGAWSFV